MTTLPPGQDSSLTRPLRVGLVLGEHGAPRWWLDAVRTAVLAGVIVIAGAISLSHHPIARYGAFDLYRRVDHRKQRRNPDPLDEVSCHEIVGEAPHTIASTVMGEAGIAVPAEALATLDACKPDLVLSALSRRVVGPVLSLPEFGVWHVYFDVESGAPRFPDGFWPMVEQRPVTTVQVRALGLDVSDDAVVASLATATDRFSLHRGRINRSASAAGMLSRELSRLQQSRMRPTARLAQGAARAEVVRAPTTLDVVRWHVRRAVPRFHRAWLDRMCIPEWSLAIHVAPDVEDDPCTDLRRFQPLPVAEGTYQADPCVVVHQGRHYVFLEEYVWATRRGRISVMELDPSGNHGPLHPALERPYHLSYPCVFQWNDTWYMVPETMEHGTVELYRATSFPDDWVFDRVLLDGVQACDATIHMSSANQWWMFVTLSYGEAPAIEELHLYHAEAPTGPWRASKDNPIRADVRGARPAGRLVRTGGRLLRPGQDCAEDYGHFIRLFEVERLAEMGYSESEVGRIGPDARAGFERVHTLSHAGRVTAVDLWRWKPRWT